MDVKSKNLPANMALSVDDQQTFTKKVNQLKKEGRTEKGVIYLGHIPHGFFEDQMRQYFSQFGEVTRLRLARSKRTGRMKGYAFVEFASDAVAKIVADTMNNYLMFHKLLKCQYLPAEKVHKDTFVGADRMFKKPKSHTLAIERHNSVKNAKKLKQSLQKAIKKNKKTSAALEEMGIKFEFEIKKAVSKEEKEVDEGDSSSEETAPRVKRKRTQSPSSKVKQVIASKTVEKPSTRSKISAAKNNTSVKTAGQVQKSSKSPLTGRKIAKPSSKQKDNFDVKNKSKKSSDSSPKKKADNHVG